MPETGERLQLGDYQRAVDTALKQMKEQDIIPRIWDRDHTVWKPEPDEIANRLGWLDIATRVKNEIDEMQALLSAALKEGYTDVLLMGMGGSSLAPEVFSRVFGPVENGLSLSVIDSTDPDAVRAYADQLNVETTLFIVATKSGSTVETLSFFKFFYNKTLDAVGEEKAGEHFIAITDGGSKLDKLAADLNFRATWRNDPEIGGRYSALSYFGMVPAALIGMDVQQYLQRGALMANECLPPGNPAARLGTVLSVLAKEGRDKLTFIVSPPVAPFGDWVEQLVAESTGKEGKGILPVVGEAVGTPEVYGDDRLFVYLRLNDDPTYDREVAALADAGHPVIRYDLRDRYDLAVQMFLWELATAVAGYHLGINPFNQPNVESAKIRAREMIDAYTSEGQLPEEDPALSAGLLSVYGGISADSPEGALLAFIKQGQPGDYLALQAYVQSTEETDKQLRELQTRLRNYTKLATTLGYGPRFLHSTGQLHKGDAGNGLFIQLTSDVQQGHDLPIPDAPGSEDSSIKFGVLKLAQAMGDRQALLDEGRRVIRFDLANDVHGCLNRLLDTLNV